MLEAFQAPPAPLAPPPFNGRIGPALPEAPTTERCKRHRRTRRELKLPSAVEAVTRKRRAPSDLEGLWPRRFEGVKQSLARTILISALRAVGLKILAETLAKPEPEFETPPADPIAVFAASIEGVHKILQGVPVIAPEDVGPEMGVWLEVEHGRPGRASTEIRLYSRAPKEAIERALSVMAEAFRTHGMPALYKDVWPAPRKLVAHARIGVLRVIPKAA